MRGKVKRVKNPLNKRIFKDILRDWRRYLMIFLVLTVTIGFISGMYIANNSMLLALDECAEKYNTEGGHFILTKPADKKILRAVEAGEFADVPSVLRERAYDEAEEKVEKAVREAVEKKIKEAVEDSLTKAAEREKEHDFSKRERNGETITAAQKKAEKEEAVRNSLDEDFESEYEDTLKEFYDSDKYEKAYDKALLKAQKAIDKEIDKEYTNFAEEMGLDSEDCKSEPVTIYSQFYKDVPERLPADGSYEGKIRIYGQRREVNMYDLLEGRSPKNGNEIIIDRMHADNAKIKVGDTVKAGGQEFTVVGLAAFSDYSTLYESNTDTMFDALTFDVGMTTDEGYERVKSHQNYCYVFTYENKPADIYEEKISSDNVMRSLVTQFSCDEDYPELDEFVPAYANHALTFAADDLGSDKAMGGVLLYILTAVLAFIFAVTISTTLEQESSVIGTLRASGYTIGELIRYYMCAPILIVFLAAIVGNILGYTSFKEVIVSMYYNSYSLPSYKTVFTSEALIKTTIVPILLMLVINYSIISKTLQLSPLRFLRHDIKKQKRSKAVRLPRWNFFGRFRLRILLQNLPNYLTLLAGIGFVMLMLSMAVGMPATLEYYQDNMPGMVIADEQLILSDYKDEDGRLITTRNKDADKFMMNSLVIKDSTAEEEVSVYGIGKHDRYLPLDEDFFTAAEQNVLNVYVSKAYAEKYSLSAGDWLVLSEKFEHKDYQLKVYGIYDYEAAVAVFMTDKQFRSTFGLDSDYFTGYFSSSKITDIDENYIAKEITPEDMTKLAKQLDHSMGSYMLYFQYVCVIVSAILLYLLTKMIIEKNERSISMVKVLGYSTGEIASLYLMTTAIVVILSEVITIWLGYVIMTAAWKVIMMSMGGWFSFVMPSEGFVREFVLVFAAYAFITLADFNRIRHIPKVLALKNTE